MELQEAQEVLAEQRRDDERRAAAKRVIEEQQRREAAERQERVRVERAAAERRSKEEESAALRALLPALREHGSLLTRRFGVRVGLADRVSVELDRLERELRGEQVDRVAEDIEATIALLEAFAAPLERQIADRDQVRERVLAARQDELPGERARHPLPEGVEVGDLKETLRQVRLGVNPRGQEGIEGPLYDLLTRPEIARWNLKRPGIEPLRDLLARHRSGAERVLA